MRPLELTRSGIFGTLAVFLVAGVCIRLGFWQLDRRDQVLTRNAAVAERLSAEPVALDAAPRDTAGLTHRRVTVVGRMDSDRSIVLAGRSHAGAPGVHLLTPLRTGSGAVLVNRGWLPSADAATVDLAPVSLEGLGVVRVEGVLLPFPAVDLPRQPGFQRTWFRFDGDAVRAQYPYPVAPLYLLATVRPHEGAGSGAGAEGTGPTGVGDQGDVGVGGAGEGDASVRQDAGALPVILAPPTLDPGPHLSYAFQWFSFATIFLVGWAVMLVRAGRNGGYDREVSLAPGAPQPPASR